MKNKKDSLNTEVKTLLKDCVIAESSNQVWSQFSTAMGSLDDESQQLLEAYFGGMTTDELSQQTQVSKDKLERWIAKAKRDLINQLRNEMRMKQ